MPNHTEFLELLLKNRGINLEDQEKFLNPKYEDLYDPFLLKDMEKACVRLFEAIKANEKVVIYSDYDCDGIPSAVIINDFFKKIGFENYTIYIPDRNDEGYGLHSDAILEFIKNKINLLITFDLGITAVDEVANAQVNNIDVIIVDHHITQEKIPPAFAIINPKQGGCNYPDQMLCGAGLSFKFIQALIIKYGEYWKIYDGWEKWMLDMVGIATLADQVPLLDENRIFAYYGLKVLKKTKRFGLQEIFYKARIQLSKLQEEDITFTLAPRINAASRMDSPMKAFKMLATQDLKEAKTLANHLVKINDERKYLVARIMKEVKKVLLKRLKEKDKPIIVIGNPKWHIGVLGIIAAKIVDEYKKPVFVWGTDKRDFIKGSCRSYGNINLVELMTSLSENSLLEFGGHSMAGGFSVSHEEIHFLEERLVGAFNNSFIQNEKIDEVQKIDVIISIDDVTNENYKVIEKLAPFGISNPKPTFLLRNIKIDKIKEFGKEKNHLELSFLNSKNKIIKAIAFFKIAKDFSIEEGNKINIIATLEVNNFLGKSELRLRIVDIV